MSRFKNILKLSAINKEDISEEERKKYENEDFDDFDDEELDDEELDDEAEEESIFPTQEEFIMLMEDAGFKINKFQNLTGGVVSLYTGYRI